MGNSKADILKKFSSTPAKTRSFAQLVYESFKPTDLVRIKNVVGHDTGWPFVNPDETVVDQPDKSTRRVTPGQQRVRFLGAGKTVLIHGWEAYIALDVMWKEYAQTRNGKRASAVMNSAIERESFFNEAFMGIFDPNADDDQTVVTKTAEKELGEDLGFDDEEEENEEEEKKDEANTDATKSAPTDTGKTGGSANTPKTVKRRK